MSIEEIINVGGIPTVRATRAELAARMVQDCLSAASGKLTTPKVVISSNGAVIADFHASAAFREMVLAADIRDADGMPLVFATRIFCHRPLPERVATTDFIRDAAIAAVGANLRFYFLGGKPGVAEMASAYFRKHYPGLMIVGVRHGYFGTEDEAAICEEVRRLKTDVLWVGLGSPLQESFAQRNKHRLNGLGWIRTCGGLFDHYSGRLRRAPFWLQSAGLEWLHRAIAEPLRLGPRYLRTNFHAAFYLATMTSDNMSSPDQVSGAESS